MKISVAIRTQLTRGIASTVVLSSGLLSPVSWSAPGDLDPAFGEVGRVGPLIDLQGPAWALELQDDKVTFGGGYYLQHCENQCIEPDDIKSFAGGFTQRMSAAGTTDPAFPIPALDDVQVLDIARQPDNRVIGVGRSVRDNLSKLTVFRLESDGGLDLTFGDAGIVRYGWDEYPHAAASAVAVDPDGRIVVAGRRAGALIVLRLNANGGIDTEFGDAGLHVGPRLQLVDPQILRTAIGGYRITENSNPSFLDNPRARPTCRVLGLTASGLVDESFGSGGYASTGIFVTTRCSSLGTQPDGRLLVAGSAGGRGFAIRLTANGVRDSEFSADALADAMTHATAMAVGGDGSILVAGDSSGVTGAVIIRMLPSGEPDPLFGKAGTTWVDLAADFGSAPVVRDIRLLADGGALLAGGDESAGPFIARLIGDDGRAGPGVVGVMHPSVVATQQSGQAIVTVRRTGGASGEVSVSYGTNPGGASAGEDYTAVEGQLQWADGDAGDQQIVVPIAADSAVDPPEKFDVVLANAQGGAALGSRATVVEIAPDGGAVLGMEVFASTVREGDAVQVTVRRDQYARGAVTVTLTATAGTAGAQDFDTAPITISWADGDTEPRVVALGTTDDSDDELAESFTVALGQPTGVAVIGPLSSASITIDDDDEPASSDSGDDPPGDSGGGGFEWLSLLLLGATGLRRWHGKRAASVRRSSGDSRSTVGRGRRIARPRCWPSSSTG